MWKICPRRRPAAKQKVAPDAPPPPPPSKVAEPGEVAAAISAAGVTTVKEEAVQQGEQDIDKVYKFRDAILEGATALNIETKAELVELFTKHAIESTSGEKVVPRKYFDQLLTELKVDAKDPSTLWIAGISRTRTRCQVMASPLTSWDCWTIYS